IGQNMIYNIIATGLYFYFQSVIFIPAMAISIIFAVARVWDAINDPMMGTIVDKTRSKYGKCRPYLMAVPSICAVITILSFINGIYSEDNSNLKNTVIIIWAAVSYVLWGMCYTAGDIPIWSMPSLMTESDKDRSTILSLARIVAAIGAGAVIATITPVSQSVGKALESVVGQKHSQQYGFIIVAVVLTIIGTALFQCASYAKERVEKTDKTPSFKENIKTMVGCKPFFRILISGILKSPIFLLNNIAFTVLSYYYGNYYDNYIKYLVILGGALYIGQFAAMALIPKLSLKFEKKKLYNFLSIAGALPYTGIYIMYKAMPTSLDQTLGLVIGFIVFFGAGIPMGGLSVLQSVMIADTVDYEEYHNNNRPDGIFFSGQSFITKLSSGISSIISGVVFTIVGFSGTGVQKINESLYNGAEFKTAYPQVASAMFFAISIPAAVGMVLSAIPMFKYEIDNKTHTKILNSLIERRKDKEADNA
ncbi:MAG: MFS transporter, partial [Eubacterium sp.]